jgi:hypothetical protein
VNTDCPVCAVLAETAYQRACRALDQLRQLITTGPADQIPAAARAYDDAVTALGRLQP